MPEKLTEEECHKRLVGRSLIMIKYAGKASKVHSTFKCLDCGNVWGSSFNNVDQGNGCPPCKRKKVAEGQTLKPEDWDRKLEGKFIKVVKYGKNVDDRSSVFQCLREGCRNKFNSTLYTVTKDSTAFGCPKCANKSTAEKLRYPNSYYDEVVSGRDLSILKYGTSLSKPDTTFKCNKIRKDGTPCEYVWVSRLQDVRAGHGCPKCGKSLPLTVEECNEKLKGRGITVIKYAGSRGKISEFKCQVCDHEWSTSFESVSYGSKCPNCRNKWFDARKPTWVYILRISSIHGDCYGFGVTQGLDRRMRDHKKSLGNAIEEVYTPIYFDSGVDALKLEYKWKQSPYAVDLGVKGFKTECVLINNETTDMIFNFKI